ncbi:MAG TPA: LamG-like jellyroll fold domain-containing protein, partial [Actinomycetota bacterium]|nr:LamG-like jellyroll fold domain-containing protein [Actinomycetota bacterium]
TRYSYVTDLSVDEDTVYASANGEGGGVFDGRVAADPYTGELRWVDTCLGATWSIEVVGDLVYSGSHAHDCRNTAGGFPEIWNVPPPLVRRHNRLLAQLKGGEDAPTIQHWFPTTNGGIVGKLGPRDMAGTDDQLWVAGEFTTVNGRSQWGLTRFGLAPAAASHTPARPVQPSAVSVRPGEVRVSWPATEDFDDERLTYTVLRGRDTGSMQPVGTIQADSKPWYRPTLAFTDSGLEPGESWVYQVSAADPSGRTSPRSWAASVSVAGAASPYANRILNDGAGLYWRLDDAAGATRATSLVGSWGTYRTGVTTGTTGALVNVDPQSPAVATNATAAGVVGSDEVMPGPQTFSAEAWFKTTAGTGGRLLGFGDSALGTSSRNDRQVYMLRNGQLSFGVASGGPRVVTSPRPYNDGQWHHVVATLGAAGQRLYVDGRLVAQNAAVTSALAYSGHWRLGGDNLDNWPNAGSRWFNGQLDEFAVYASQLSAGTIAAHHALDAPDTQAPSAPTGLSVAVSGSAAALSWSEATDNVAVARYEVHRSAVPGFAPSAATRVATVTGTSRTEDDVPPGTWYYRVVASDPAGNRGAPSAQVEAVVEEPPVEPVTVTLAPAADAWVDSTAPTTNRGNAWGLSSDGAPEQAAYLRFDLPDAPAGTALRGAILRLSTTASTWSGSASEHSVSVTDGAAWTESGLTFQNRPAVSGSPIGSVAAGTSSDATYQVDLSVAQLQARLGAAATLVLSTQGADAIQVSSKEQPTPAGRPQLVLDFG